MPYQIPHNGASGIHQLHFSQQTKGQSRGVGPRGDDTICKEASKESRENRSRGHSNYRTAGECGKEIKDKLERLFLKYLELEEPEEAEEVVDPPQWKRTKENELIFQALHIAFSEGAPGFDLKTMRSLEKFLQAKYGFTPEIEWDPNWSDDPQTEEEEEEWGPSWS